MLRSLFTAATGMEAQQLKMDTIANNLANASTPGFKRVRADFEDLLSETMKMAQVPDPRGGTFPTPMQVGLGVRTGSTSRSLTPGEQTITGRPLDVSINGAGFLRVQLPSGDFAFTRAGNLMVDAQGRLTTHNGEILEPAITLPHAWSDLTIKPDGVVSVKVPGRSDQQEVGQMELSNFSNPAGMAAIGGNLLAANDACGEEIRVKPGDQGTGAIAQNMLEGSNVKAVEEMIDMISTQRAYEMNSKTIQTADQMLQRLTSLR